MRKLILAATLSALLTPLTFAQDAHHKHLAHPVAEPQSTATTSTQEFEEANAKMHSGMATTMTGNADIDFVTGMIPHHQGAIDMARIVLKYGQDKETKKLASAIIKAQEKEIKWMTAWLKKNQPKNTH